MPAQELSHEQKADAKRLKAAFAEHQAKLRQLGLPATQEALAEQLGFGQSALSQYLNGAIPLNAAALTKFCKMLLVEPASISPGLVAEERAKRVAWADRSHEAIDLAEKIEAIADPATRQVAYVKALRAIQKAVDLAEAKTPRPASARDSWQPKKKPVATP